MIATKKVARGAAGVLLVAGLGFGLLSAMCADEASTNGPKVYIITHVDVAPLPAGPGIAADPSAIMKRFPEVISEGETLLRQLAVESRRDPGCIAYQVLQEPRRRNHFTIVQTWSDEASFVAHEAAAHTRATREKLQPILAAPLDQRLHLLFE